jgi:hypothetical protein
MAFRVHGDRNGNKVRIVLPSFAKYLLAPKLSGAPSTGAREMDSLKLVDARHHYDEAKLFRHCQSRISPPSPGMSKRD